jgi:membrane protein DedA with SNARE-associated domain
VKVEKGYQGPAVVCALYFSPVSGYVPDRAAVKYLTKLRDMEVWFAPVAGTRYLMPLKVVIPTPLGTGIMQATRFVTSQPTAVARTQ